jgi:hypothetical protein
VESEIRTVVTFESTAFNMATPRDYFINPCCCGDDVAVWLIRELRKQGMKTDEKPGQEDFGWCLNFEAAGVGHTFVIGHRPNGETEAGTWIGWLDRLGTRRTQAWNSRFGSASNSPYLNRVFRGSRRALAFPARLR